MRLSVVVGALALTVTSACGREIQLSSSTGLDPIRGETIAVLDDSTCAMAWGDCHIRFERDVIIATKKSYLKLDGLVAYVKAVDLDVRTLAFLDGDLGRRFIPDGKVTIAQTLELSPEDLSALPQRLRLEGEAFEPVRQQILASDPATLHVVADLVISQPLPSYLVVYYDVQPVLLIGEQ